MINHVTIEMEITKTCSKCGQSKPLEQFPKSYRPKGGRCNPCKTCKLIQTNAWRNRNKDHVNNCARIRSKHPRYLEANRQRQARWKENDREHYLEQKRMQTNRRRARDKGITLEEYLAKREPK